MAKKYRDSSVEWTRRQQKGWLQQANLKNPALAMYGPGATTLLSDRSRGAVSQLGGVAKPAQRESKRGRRRR